MRRMLAVGAGVATIGLAGAAEAEHSCAEGIPIHFTPTADALGEGFEVEGPIGDFDPDARTITAIGMTFSVPETTRIETIDRDGPGNLTFEELVDPAREAQRSIIGATTIATGTLQVLGSGTELCLVARAGSVYVEMAENVLFGPLLSVETGAGNLVANINGVPVAPNTDPRWRSVLIDEGGNEYPLERLADLVGQAVSAEGYFEAGFLRATVFEFEGVLPGDGTDTVAITRAEAKNGGARVRGSVSLDPATGTFVGQVTVHRDGLAPGGGCGGAIIGTAAVNQGSGKFELRTRAGGAPAVVCVASPAGGAAESPVEPD